MEKPLKILVQAAGVVATFMFISMITTMKMDQYKAHAALMQELEHPSAAHIEQELSCMAMNIYREAAGEPFEGKVAVAQVTMNRVDHPGFPDSICAVVHEKNVFMKRVVCQFSWYCSNNVMSRPLNSASYNESYEVAKKVMLEDFKLESVQNAIYYHADSISPNWNYQLVTKIGNHIFYTDRG